ncbi:hypothetical protein GF361_04535 [Candidatus Woesearchaeota archaeon]|nr:hypothetical protein [Candidatus Woesearchaeota archaeon]
MTFIKLTKTFIYKNINTDNMRGKLKKMFMLKRSKKGISPLLATVILLVFAVGLGIVVMNWGRAHVEAASKCAVDTGLSIVNLNNIPEICYAGKGEKGYVHFIVENGPSVDLEGLQLRIIGTKNVYNLEIKENIPKGNSLLKDIPYNFDGFGDIRQIKITPKIMLYPEEKPILCPEQALVTGEIRSC